MPIEQLPYSAFTATVNAIATLVLLGSAWLAFYLAFIEPKSRLSSLFNLALFIASAFAAIVTARAVFNLPTF